jgi:hypothetical protein
VAAPSAVFTIALVAKMLGVDEDWLWEVAREMDPEAGCLTVYGTDDVSTTAFTSFGIENLKELVEIDKANPTIIERYRKLG